ncbi:MAG: AraC family transcriptional regulator [Eubacteriales bacterium]|nr:AraC family transcriptional regulator [Eubacteriales bacterium]
MLDFSNYHITVYKIKAANSDIRQYYVSGHFKLCIINKGEGVWEIGNRPYNVTCGDIVILNNRENRAFSEIHSEYGVNITVIDFDPEFVINTQFAGLFFSKDAKSRIHGTEELIRLFKEIETEEIGKLVNFGTIIGAKLINILALLCRENDMLHLDYNPFDNDIAFALKYIEQNYTSNISISEIASQLHMSCNCLSKKFSRSMRISFTEHVIQKRIHKAIRLLNTSTKTVLDIALECGFNNAANFYKAFKKTTGTTPKDYRHTNKTIYY